MTTTDRTKIEVRALDKRVSMVDLAPKTLGSAGIDLKILFNPKHTRLSIQPGQTSMLSTGLAVWIKDPALVGIITIRSSLGIGGLVLANQIGVIDSDYQGEIKIFLRNTTTEEIFLQNESRVAQLLFVPVEHNLWLEPVEEFSNQTRRGAGGFGSTGVK